MIELINDINVMTDDQIASLVNSFNENSYEIIESAPTRENIPCNLSKTLQNKESYQLLMEDKEADFKYFSIRFPVNNKDIILPFGVYGVSSKRNLRFPLVINGIWVSLFMLDKATFRMGLNITDTQKNDECYGNFLSWKKRLIEKIFTFYFQSNYNSVMTWVKRGDKSFTRDVAQQVGFYWKTFNDNEFYSAKELTDEEFKFAKNALFKWKVLSENEPNPRPPVTRQIISLISGVVGLKKEKTTSSIL